MVPVRRWLYAWGALGALVVCAWCSTLSGVAGWVLGSDIAAREARAEYSATETARLDLPSLGVLITRLDRNGPAAQAGLRRSDIIIALDAVQVQDARELRDLLQSYQPGTTLRATVLRDRTAEEIPVELGAFPDDQNRPYLGIYYTARAEEPADL